MASSPFARLRLNHLSIAVRDLDEAIEWYADLFGLTLDQRTRFDKPELQGENAFLSRAEIRLELWALDAAQPVPDDRQEPNSDLLTCGTKHIAFEVDGLQELLDELVERRIDIASVQRKPGEPQLREAHPESTAVPGRPPAYAAFIRDPQGTLIELLDPAQRERNRT